MNVLILVLLHIIQQKYSAYLQIYVYNFLPSRRIGRGTIVLRHYVLYFPPNFYVLRHYVLGGGIVRRASFNLMLDLRNENINKQ